MKFISIDIANFCSIAEAQFSLTEQGLVVVSGKNLDSEGSNGAGKSTAVVDSLCWAVFGKTTKGGSADSVTPGGSGKGTRVEVVFEKEGQTYSITRHRKHSKMSNKIVVLRDGEDISRSTAGENNKLVEDIVGITFDTFLYTTVLGPSSFRLSRLTDQGRRQILEDITGTSIYEDAKIAARARVKELAEEVRIAEVRVESKQRELDSAVKQAEDMQKANDRIREERTRATQQAREATQQAKEAYEAAERAALQLKEPTDYAQLSALEGLLATMQGKAQKLNLDYATAHASYEMANDLYNKAKNQDSGEECDHCGSHLTEQHMQEVLEQRAAKAETANEVVSDLAQQVESAQAQINELTQTIADIKARHDAYRQQLAQLNAQVTANEKSYQDWKAHYQKILDEPLELAADMDLVYNVDMTVCTYMSQLTRMTEELEADRIKLEDAQFWVEGFQDLRVTALEGSLDFLNSRLSQYSSSLFNGDVDVKLVHLDGKITILVSTMGGTYESASGGEKDRIDLCLAFALLDLARQCTEWGSNILVMDEIAVHVDAKGVERLMGVVESLVGNVESVFMISHNPIFDGYGDKNMIVTRSGGHSTITFD